MKADEIKELAKLFDSKLTKHPVSSEELQSVLTDFGTILIVNIATTQPHPTMAAEEIAIKHAKNSHHTYTQGGVFIPHDWVLAAMEEYRNQPIEFNPPHSAQHEAEVLFNKLGYHKSIQILEYTMLNLKAANVSTVWHEKVLTILKGM